MYYRIDSGHWFRPHLLFLKPSSSLKQATKKVKKSFSRLCHETESTLLRVTSSHHGEYMPNKTKLKGHDEEVFSKSSCVISSTWTPMQWSWNLSIGEISSMIPLQYHYTEAEKSSQKPCTVFALLLKKPTYWSWKRVKKHYEALDICQSFTLVPAVMLGQLLGVQNSSRVLCNTLIAL